VAARTCVAAAAPLPAANSVPHTSRAACAACRAPQNPDPAAAAYFASHITKAYAALTDAVSRQNYEKYGHPDGPQVCVRPWVLPAAPPDARVSQAPQRLHTPLRHSAVLCVRACVRAQGMNLGVALPAWMFSKDKGTSSLVLLALVRAGPGAAGPRPTGAAWRERAHAPACAPPAAPALWRHARSCF
jgi:hypothetical protein